MKKAMLLIRLGVIIACLIAMLVCAYRTLIALLTGDMHSSYIGILLTIGDTILLFGLLSSCQRFINNIQVPDNEDKDDKINGGA